MQWYHQRMASLSDLAYLVMVKIQFSFIKQIKIGRPEHSLNLQPLRPITSYLYLTTDMNFIKPSPTTLRKIRNLFFNLPVRAFSVDIIFSAFSEHLCFERSDEISVFYAVPPTQTFLLKTLHCSYVNCNRFHKHEKLFMIKVQQVPKR